MLKTGDKFKLTDDAIDNYGERYRDRVFKVSHVATRYVPSNVTPYPDGAHPGFCRESGRALYDADGLNFSVYDWEIKRA